MTSLEQLKAEAVSKCRAAFEALEVASVAASEALSLRERLVLEDELTRLPAACSLVELPSAHGQFPGYWIDVGGDTAILLDEEDADVRFLLDTDRIPYWEDSPTFTTVVEALEYLDKILSEQWDQLEQRFTEQTEAIKEERARIYALYPRDEAFVKKHMNPNYVSEPLDLDCLD